MLRLRSPVANSCMQVYKGDNCPQRNIVIMGVWEGRPCFVEGQKIRTNSSIKHAVQVFPGDPVTDSMLPMQGFRVRSLVRELDPTSCN